MIVNTFTSPGRGFRQLDNVASGATAGEVRTLVGLGADYEIHMNGEVVSGETSLTTGATVYFMKSTKAAVVE